jgi:hypothetical protein
VVSNVMSMAAGGRSARHRAGLGHAPHVPEGGGDPDLERVDAETASQPLGHSSPAITREFYISKPAIAADVAQHVLDNWPVSSRATAELRE